jgi:SNF2 family DNA or RNA helicase
MDKEEVNRPSHYNHGKFEAIAVIRDWKLNFNLGNAVKYICRAGHKGNLVQDLRKALWYIQDEINFLDGTPSNPLECCRCGNIYVSVEALRDHSCAPSTQFQQISHADAYELGKIKQFDRLKKFEPKFFKIGVFEHEKLWGFNDNDLNSVFVEYWVTMSELWAHQKQAIREASLLPGYALFFGIGTGKTRTTVHILRNKYIQADRLKRTIIFTLPTIVPDWRTEILTSSKIDPKQVIMLTGDGKKRLKTFLENKDRANIFITNYESILMEPMFEALLAWGVEELVLDESQKCKSHTAKRAKLMNNLANPWDKKLKKSLPRPNVYLLSGTPILKNAMDLFQQFKIMDGGKSFTDNFFIFRAMYFVDINAGMPKDRYYPDWQLKTLERDGFDALSEISKRISAMGMRVEKEQCLDLPPLLSVIVPCAMSPEQERLYKEMKKDLITYYESKACTATMAMTKAIRLLQIASGHIKLEVPGEEDGIVKDLGVTPKYERLMELIERIVEADEKVLIWAVFKANYETIKRACDEVAKKLKKDFTYVEVHGGVSETKKKSNVATFKSDPKCRVFIGHPLSGGIGLTLTEAAYAITYSRNYSLENYLQSRGRNHRGGSKEAGHEKITHYDLVSENTIEVGLIPKLEGKEDIGDELLKELVYGF